MIGIDEHYITYNAMNATECRIPVSTPPRRRSYTSRFRISQYHAARWGNANVWWDIHLRAKKGFTCVMWIIQYANTEVMMWLYANIRIQKWLFSAVTNSQIPQKITWEADNRFGSELIQAKRLQKFRQRLPVGRPGRLCRGPTLKELPKHRNGHLAWSIERLCFNIEFFYNIRCVVMCGCIWRSYRWSCLEKL